MAQLFDPLPPDVHAALRDSVQRFGVIVPVVKDQDGNILDGHHRAAIADELGVEYRTVVRAVADQAEADAIAWTLNADRRHLTAEQRRPMVKALREQGHSQRAIAQATGVSEKQVRKDLATADQSAVPERITGLDGKSRPSRPKPKVTVARPRPRPAPAPDVPRWHTVRPLPTLAVFALDYDEHSYLNVVAVAVLEATLEGDEAWVLETRAMLHRVHDQLGRLVRVMDDEPYRMEAVHGIGSRIPKPS